MINRHNTTHVNLMVALEDSEDDLHAILLTHCAVVVPPVNGLIQSGNR